MTTPEKFGNIVLKVDAASNFVRLKDVARIEIGLSSSNVSAKVNGTALTSDADKAVNIDRSGNVFQPFPLPLMAACDLPAI